MKRVVDLDPQQHMSRKRGVFDTLYSILCKLTQTPSFHITTFEQLPTLKVRFMPQFPILST